MKGDIHLALGIDECLQLARYVDQLTQVIDDAESRHDPAVERLVPSPYPEDAAAATAFGQATREDLLDRRLADAAVVRLALTSVLDEARSFGDIQVTIPLREIDAWLRTLTVLRLIIATRLGITEDNPDDPDQPRYRDYDWLGYRLDGLVALADAQDEIRGDDEDATEA